MDLTLFHFINGFAHQSSLLDAFGIFLASYLPYLLGIALVMMLLKDRKKNLHLVAESLVAGLFSRFAIKPLVTLFIERPRPFVALEIQPLISQSLSEYHASFPSGHALFFFALATTVVLHDKKMGLLLYLGALLMGIARIFVGVHWPSDILAGAVLGIGGAILINFFAMKWVKKA